MMLAGALVMIYTRASLQYFNDRPSKMVQQSHLLHSKLIAQVALIVGMGDVEPPLTLVGGVETSSAA